MIAKSSCVPVLALALVACGTPRRQDDLVSIPVPIEELGRFKFVIEARETRVTGWIDVALDTIVARGESAPCSRSADQPDRSRLVYECAAPGISGVRLSLDRRHPVRSSKWSYFTPVLKTRDVCTAFRTWENGTQTCTRSTPEQYVEQVLRSGELVVMR